MLSLFHISLRISFVQFLMAFVRLVKRPAVKFVSKKKAVWAPVDVEAFYDETISGKGGAPVGLERDLITKFFGDGDFHGLGDHEAWILGFSFSFFVGLMFEVSTGRLHTDCHTHTYQ